MQQNIQQPQQFNFASSSLIGNPERGAGLGVTTETQNENTDNSVIDTMINSIFSSTTHPDCQPISLNNICVTRELPCIFEFLGTCSSRREDDIVYGNACLKHNNDMSRTFTPLASQTSVDMQPISLKVAACEKNMFMWSFLTNVSYAKAKDLISFMNISTTESMTLAKFIMAVSEPMGKRNNTEEYQRLQQYLSIYCQQAIKCIESVPDRDKILIPIIMGQKFRNENKRNKLVNEIFKNALETKIYSHQKVGTDLYQIYVPLKALNILDQLNILSYRMYCGIGRVSLAPNVSVTGERIYIGSGLSIRNALTSMDISKLRSVYPENIYRIIRNVHGDNVHNNYDVLVLLAVPPNTTTSINPQIFIAKRTYVVASFDIDKLDVLSVC